MKKLGLMGVVLMSGTALAADGIKLGGFADVGFTWTKDGTPATTFVVGEGAVYLGKSMGNGEMHLDLPFEYGASTDTLVNTVTDLVRAGAGDPTVTTNPTTTKTNKIVAGMERAQAWVAWKYDNGFSWKLGQFDSLYRFESNDSWGRFYTNQGILAGMVPVTHTGLLLGYKASDALGVHFMVANKFDQSVQTASEDAKFDFGVKVDGSTDSFNASVGALFTNADAGTGDSEWLVNAVAGTKMGQAALDLEFNAKKNGEKTDMGVGGHVVYAMDESLDLGVSVEWMKDGVTEDTTLNLRAGPCFNMSKDLHVRLAYGYNKAGDADAGQTIGLNAVHRF